MRPDADLVYFDASVFIAWFNDEPGRAEIIERMFNASSEGLLRLVTSIVSLTEVAYFRSDGIRLSPDQLDQQINALLLNDRLLGIIAFDHRVALRARRLVRTGAGSREGLTVLDAIHLASAEIAGCDYFATYDRDFAKASQAVEMQIGQPTLGISS